MLFDAMFNQTTDPIWRSFEIKNTVGKPSKFEIRTVGDDEKKFILTAGFEMFIKDEPCCSLKELRKCPKCVQPARDYWEKCLVQNLTMGCYEVVDGYPDILTGFNIIYLQEMTDFEDDSEYCSAWSQISTLLSYASKRSNAFEYYGVDSYISSGGLYVLPPYRRMGLGAEMLLARKAMCEHLNISASATVFTAEQSQRLASKCGFEVLAEIPYSSEELKSLGLDFEGIRGRSCKVMGIKYF